MHFIHPDNEAAPGIAIRAMQFSDIDSVVQNEVLTYEHPWSKRIFSDCLNAGYECGVLVSEDRIIGHCVMAVAAGECHLLTLCVHPELQSQGYGRRLMKHYLERAYQNGSRVCFLEVRPSNAAAKALYFSLGFEQAGERKNYYPADTGREDALILRRQLPL
ncbi:MAG: ribosomal protein S18-alanine N-acetyltransferase [Pseudohongiellaceae bacterium]